MGVGVGTGGQAEAPARSRRFWYSTTERLPLGGDASCTVGAGVGAEFLERAGDHGDVGVGECHEKSSSIPLVVSALLNQYDSSRRFASASASYRSWALTETAPPSSRGSIVKTSSLS
jgi:hypothetical protein